MCSESMAPMGNTPAGPRDTIGWFNYRRILGISMFFFCSEGGRRFIQEGSCLTHYSALNLPGFVALCFLMRYAKSGPRPLPLRVCSVPPKASTSFAIASNLGIPTGTKRTPMVIAVVEDLCADLFASSELDKTAGIDARPFSALRRRRIRWSWIFLQRSLILAPDCLLTPNQPAQGFQ